MNIFALRLGNFLGVTKSFEDIECLIVPSDLAQPARGFREEPANGQKEHQGNDLESNGEAPTQSRFAVVDEAETVSEL